MRASTAVMHKCNTEHARRTSTAVSRINAAQDTQCVPVLQWHASMQHRTRNACQYRTLDPAATDQRQKNKQRRATARVVRLSPIESFEAASCHLMAGGVTTWWPGELPPDGWELPPDGRGVATWRPVSCHLTAGELPPDGQHMAGSWRGSSALLQRRCAESEASSLGRSCSSGGRTLFIM